MDLLKVCISSIGSIFVLFIFMKVLGNRQMSQLSMFNYISGITIGSIAAEMATNIEKSFVKPLVSMIVYTAIIALLEFISEKSLKWRKIITGTSYVLYQNGKLIQENFKKSKIDINDFITQCRINGYFNLSDLDTAILETTGHISFLPKSIKRPANPQDFGISTTQEKPVFNVIIDGQIIEENLKATGNDKTWLEQNIKKQKISNISNIFLATCDTDNNLSIYTR